MQTELLLQQPENTSGLLSPMMGNEVGIVRKERPHAGHRGLGFGVQDLG